MRFLYIKVLQILNLMLRIVAHVPRVSHVTGIFTQLWGTMQLMSPRPRRKLWGTCPPVPAGFTPLVIIYFIASLTDDVDHCGWLSGQRKYCNYETQILWSLPSWFSFTHSQFLPWPRNYDN